MVDERASDTLAAPDPVSTLTVVAHELAVALELSYSPSELTHLWGDALDGLRDTVQILAKRGLPAPSVIEHVLKLAESTS